MNHDIEAWNSNAKARHQQIITGEDVTFWHVLVPTMQRLITNLPSKQTKNLLEIGCGSGVLANEISNLSSNVIGIDPADEFIKIGKDYCSTKRNISFVCVGVENYSRQTKEKFDVIIANMVFHAIEDLPQAFHAVFSLLRDNGDFIFTIPHPVFYRLKVKPQISDENPCYFVESSHKIPFTIHNDKVPLSSYTPYYHRPIEKYSKYLVDSRLYIHQIFEPVPSQKIMKDEYKQQWLYTGFLTFHCKKIVGENIR